MREFLFEDLRNQFWFSLRSRLGWSRPFPSIRTESKNEVRLQNEVSEFLSAFTWSAVLNKIESNPIFAADIGARNFAMAPVFEKLFKSQGRESEIHGFEIDPYRRMVNFRTRADYGRFFASKIERGFYHPFDFLKWNGKIDVAFLLHPFVTKKPLMSWGLPLRELRPRDLFEHTLRSLSKNGVLLLCSPTDEEKIMALEFARAAGFIIVEERDWHPQADSLQTLSRLGVLATK